MKKLQLRQYQASDYEAVWQLHVDGINQTGSFVYTPTLDDDFKNIEEIYLKNHGVFFVASLNSQVIGMGALRKIDDRTAEVKRMRVKAEYQGQGIGTFILDSLIGKAKELGYRKLVLDTSKKQIAAQRLYEKRGFRQYKTDAIGSLNVLYFELDLEQ